MSETASVTKTFHLGDLITIVTGRLVSPNHVDGIYAVCDFVAGEQHMTHQLPRAMEAVQPWLLEQHPWLADIEVPQFDLPDGVSCKDAELAVMTWLAGPVARYGEYHEVKAMPFGMYVGREPIAELREMAPHAQIIGVGIDPDRDGAS